MSSAIYYNLSGKAKPWEPIMVCVDPVPDHEGVPWYTTWRVNMLDAIHRNLGIKPCARRANVYDVHTGEGGKPRGRCSRLDECLGAVYHPSNLLKKMHPERYPVIPDDMSLVPWQNGNELRQYALVMAEIAANTVSFRHDRDDTERADVNPSFPSLKLNTATMCYPYMPAGRVSILRGMSPFPNCIGSCRSRYIARP